MKNRNDDFQVELEKQYSILIKAENKEQKRRAIIMITILSITLIATIIGSIFAFKAYKITKELTEEEISSNEVYYQTLVTTYGDNPNISITELTTGYASDTKTIIISNEGNANITYSLKLTSVSTNLLSTNNLVYTLIGDNNTNITKELPLSESKLLDEVVIAPKETVTYTFKINFNGALDRYDIKYNYNATFQVEEIDNQTDLLE